MAQAAHVLGQCVLPAQLPVHAWHLLGRSWQWTIAHQPGRHGVIGQFGVVVYARPVQGGLLQLPVRGEAHVADQGEPVFAGVE